MSPPIPRSDLIRHGHAHGRLPEKARRTTPEAPSQGLAGAARWRQSAGRRAPENIPSRLSFRCSSLFSKLFLRSGVDLRPDYQKRPKLSHLSTPLGDGLSSSAPATATASGGVHGRSRDRKGCLPASSFALSRLGFACFCFWRLNSC